MQKWFPDLTGKVKVVGAVFITSAGPNLLLWRNSSTERTVQAFTPLGIGSSGRDEYCPYRLLLYQDRESEKFGFL